ncbi:MAG TPA: hypothetical protein VL241_08245 [Gemmatimonadales bacterium]|nr:hypothetical protein [Gemmatimonadales bacterium]
MLPPFLGALLLLATAGIVALALLVAVIGALSGNRLLARRALAAGGVMTGVYVFFFGLGFLLARVTVLEPGHAVSFCGLDCHLHVSVDGMQPGADLGVTVRFSSDAVRSPEYPRELQFRLLDGTGQRFAPLNEVPDRPLQAGESWTHQLHFPAAAQAAGASLLVSWKPGLDYLVPGSGNPFVQQHRRLALPPRA